ncbi:hypothetical protein AB0J38_36160 [Streptomyces sp. NPDC050095]|uniref:hypothetical protein n=1 Tax=unclassified Streptomyces TaxID=2593676 RepID=UPI003413EA1E
MSATTVALVVGVIGVVGTLLSALLTQGAADRAKRRDLDAAERRHAADLKLQREQTSWNLRRGVYVSLNMASRQYLASLVDMVHAMRRGEPLTEAAQQLEQARTVHRDRYAEAQLIVPEPVLALAGAVNNELGDTYGMVRRLEEGRPEPGESLETARERVEAHWAALRGMREQMRMDLGVSGGR